MTTREEREAHHAFVLGVKTEMEGKFDSLSPADRELVLGMSANFHYRDGTKNPEPPMGTISIRPGQLNNLLALALLLGRQSEATVGIYIKSPIPPAPPRT